MCMYPCLSIGPAISLLSGFGAVDVSAIYVEDIDSNVQQSGWRLSLQVSLILKGGVLPDIIAVSSRRKPRCSLQRKEIKRPLHSLFANKPSSLDVSSTAYSSGCRCLSLYLIYAVQIFDQSQRQRTIVWLLSFAIGLLFSFCYQSGLASILAVASAYVTNLFLFAVLLWGCLFAGGALVPVAVGILLSSVPFQQRSLSSAISQFS